MLVSNIILASRIIKAFTIQHWKSFYQIPSWVLLAFVRLNEAGRIVFSQPEVLSDYDITRKYNLRVPFQSQLSL